MNQQVIARPADTVVMTNDEIDLTALVANLWRQRGLIVGFMVASVAAIIAYQAARGLFSAQQQVDYPIALTFLQSQQARYPSGNAFSPNDLKAPIILKAVLAQYSLGVPIDTFAKAINVSYSNSLLAEAQQKLEDMLADGNQQPEDVRDDTLKVLDDLKQDSQRYITIHLDIEPLGLTVAQSVKIVQSLVEQWVRTSFEQGLFDADIGRPVHPLQIASATNLIDSYDLAENYSASIAKAVRQLAAIPGVESLTIKNKSLSDLQREVSVLQQADINPLRAYAYSNASLLAKANPAAQVRLMSRKRLLELEQQRLTKLIASYDQALEQMSVSYAQADVQRPYDAGQGNLQLDQSVINSLLQMGSELGGVDNRNKLFELRTQTEQQLYQLEKEMAILTGVTDDSAPASLDAIKILQQALPGIEQRLSALQQDLTAFVVAYRERTIQSGTDVYSAQSAPMVSGAYHSSLKRALTYSVLAAVLGMMLGVFIALIRLAIRPNEQQVSA